MCARSEPDQERQGQGEGAMAARGMRADGRTAGWVAAGVLDVVARLAGRHQAHRVMASRRHAGQHVGAVRLPAGDVVQLRGQRGGRSVAGLSRSRRSGSGSGRASEGLSDVRVVLRVRGRVIDGAVQRRFSNATTGVEGESMVEALLGSTGHTPREQCTCWFSCTASSRSV